MRVLVRFADGTDRIQDAPDWVVRSGKFITSFHLPTADSNKLLLDGVSGFDNCEVEHLGEFKKDVPIFQEPPRISASIVAVTK